MSAREGQQRQREHLGCFNQIVNRTPLVRLVSEVQDAWPIGDAVVHPGNAIDVLVIVGSGTRDKSGRIAEHVFNRPIHGANQWRLFRREYRMHDEQIAQVVKHVR